MIISIGYNGYSTDKLAEGRVGLFLCECGCGQEFFSNYRTRQPRYANKTHRARAYRARARARIYADSTTGMMDNDFATNKQISSAWKEAFDFEYNYLLSLNRGKP
jgi:hypothetical protein